MCIVSVYCYHPYLLLKGEYSELRHDGPKNNSKKVSFLTYFSLTNSLMQYQPPAADEEGYNRITHDLVGINIFCALAYCITSQNPASENPASLTYDEVTINSDKV